MDCSAVIRSQLRRRLRQRVLPMLESRRALLGSASGLLAGGALGLVASPAAADEAGEPMPDGCDCVLDQDSIDRTSPLVQAIAEAAPGQGVRRKSSGIAEGSRIAAPGEQLSSRDLLLARMAGLERLPVRRPRVSIINLPVGTATARLIADNARDAGADVSLVTAGGRDAAEDF